VNVDESITSTTGQRINYVIIAALAMVVLFQQFSPSLSKLSPFAEASTDAEPIAIAVLPFADLSADGDQEYLGDGVAEEILNVLADVDGLKVTSRTSAFAFKEQNRPIPEIASILGVSHVVEGSIRKQNDQVRITAQLIEVANDSHLWSETYDSDLSDIFRLQDEIAGQISSALSSSLNLALPGVERETPDWNVGAYELYLRARQLVVARTEYDAAVDLLDAAITLEPEFADAWAEKATALALRAFNLGLIDESIDASYATYEEAWLAARRAISIEPRHPLGLAAQGLVRMNQKRWIEARVYLDRAVDVDSPNDYAFLWLGILRAITGDIEGALASFDAGLELSPTAPNLIRYRNRILASQGQWRQIWNDRVRPPAMDMEQTQWFQQVAGLYLGEISFKDFEKWMQADSRGGEIGTSAAIIALADSLFGDERSPVQITALFNAQDNWTQQSMLELQPSLTESYFQINLAAMKAAPNRNDLEFLWTQGAERFRNSNESFELVRDFDLPAYWDLYDWPAVCRPTSARDFECD
jgi:TolB-like protein